MPLGLVRENLPDRSMRKCDYFEAAGNGQVECQLCPHRCRILPDHAGICGARKNVDGNLFSRNYGIVSGLSMDPIEKKPLYHFHPGSSILSIGTIGCNLHCQFCQNHPLSRYFDSNEKVPETEYRPEDMVQILKEELEKKPNGKFGGIAYTYSEPVVWIEYVKDTARLMKAEGFKNVLVTNGFIEPGPLGDLLPLVDAANIDLKAFTEEHYHQMGGKLKPVMRSIEQFAGAGVHVELTTLVVTGLNDDIFELEKMVRWIAGISPSIPYHISRYFPQYRYTKPATDMKFLLQVREMALKHLKYVYVGNATEDNSTRCRQCGNLLVERNGYQINTRGIDKGQCVFCGSKADIIM